MEAIGTHLPKSARVALTRLPVASLVVTRKISFLWISSPQSPSFWLSI